MSRYKGQVKFSVVVFSDRKNKGEMNNVMDQNAASSIVGIPASDVLFACDLGSNNLHPRLFDNRRDDVRQIIESAQERFKPDIIFCPALTETMQDHVAVGEETFRICRDVNVIGYEVARHNRCFRSNMFVFLEEQNIIEKFQMVSAFTEFRRYYFSKDALRSLAVVRALDAGRLGLAEAFQVYRLAM